MHRFSLASAFAVIALLAAPGGVRAATVVPVVSGAYTVATTEICQFQTTLTGSLFVTGLGKNGVPNTAPALTALNTASPGSLSQSVGVMTFTPTVAGGASGKVTIKLMQTGGSLSVQQSIPGGAVSGTPIDGPAPNIVAGTYAVAAGLLTVTPTGQPAIAFSAVFANIVSNVARTVAFVGQSNPGACSLQGTALHQ